MPRIVKGTNVTRYRELRAGGIWNRSKRGTVCIVRTETHYREPDANGDRSDVQFQVSGSTAEVWAYLVDCLPTVRLATVIEDADADTATVVANWSY